MVQMNLFTTQKYCYRCRKLVVTKEGSRAVINWEINFEIHISDHLSAVFKYLQWFLMSVWRNVLILMQFEPLLLFFISSLTMIHFLTKIWLWLSYLSLRIPMKWSEVKSLSHVGLFAAPWTVAQQATPSMGFSRPEYWSGVPFPSPEDLPDPGIEPQSPAL